MEYDVFLGGQPIGKAQVIKEGLYYQISGKCHLSGAVVCKLTVSCGDHTEDLGVFVPEGAWFTVNKKVPVKRLGEGQPQFRVVPRHPELGEMFVPLRPEEPFAYIKRLGRAHLERRDGILGIRLENMD